MRANTPISRCGRAGLALTMTLVLGACASGLSKEECRLADWRTIGYEDGARGAPQSRIGEHRKACAEHGVAPDLDAYRSGWNDGVQGYCRPGNGYRLGRAGSHYSGVCPATMEPAFLQAYGHGREIHSLEHEVKRLQRTLNHKHSRMEEIEVEMRDTGIDLVAAEMTTEERVVLLDQLRKLEQERSATRDEIPFLEAELEQHRQRLATVSAGRPY